jgi:hypothetical protein
MPIFTFYNPDTGEINGWLQGKLESAELHPFPFIEGKWSDLEYRIIDNTPSPIPKEEIESKVLVKSEENLRQTRNGLLSESDWTQIPDAPLTEAQKTEWQTYRQQLRDLPSNTEDPRNVTWPTKPSS